MSNQLKTYDLEALEWSETGTDIQGQLYWNAVRPDPDHEEIAISIVRYTDNREPYSDDPPAGTVELSYLDGGALYTSLADPEEITVIFGEGWRTFLEQW